MKTKQIVLMFSLWRIGSFIAIALSIFLIPLQNNFLGGEIANYSISPIYWSLGNFDGQHYLSIAMHGYKPLQYFYFPAYPYIVGWLSNPFNFDIWEFHAVGITMSHVLFFAGLVGLVKLLALDYDQKIIRLTILLILLFPTSFFFGNFYTESLFFASNVWTFLFARKKKWFLACALAGLSSATRLVGVIMLPVVLFEMYSAHRAGKFNRINYLYLLICPLGLTIYLLYLHIVHGDALLFVKDVGLFGAQRSANIILLPQVFYRYIFKVIPNLSLYYPALFTTLLEFAIASLFLILAVVGYFKLRFSYFLFLIGGYIVPTFSGSFSSMPRYAIILFPGFILLAEFLSKKSRVYIYFVYLMLATLSLAAISLFARGYFVS